MARCYICGEEKGSKKMYPKRVVGKNVCKICFHFLGDDNSFFTPERGVLSFIIFDEKGKAKRDEGGGRFKRHKG